VHAKAEFLKLINWRIAAEADGAGGTEAETGGAGGTEAATGRSEHRLGPAAASATKVFGTQFATEAYRTGRRAGAGG
jgi:3-oxocholest-4-en-26-oyl-CoA dehydrogenase alpha subunit